VWKGGEDAVCLKAKAELPINGGLAFFMKEKALR
jgi:hypothetical protein